jgi:hypothetical protein
MATIKNARKIFFRAAPTGTAATGLATVRTVVQLQ